MDIVERFINYTKINTTTSRENGAKGIMPSSPGQMKLAKLLVSELEALGMEDIILRENAIVTATLPANTDETIPVVSFFGHLDTSAEQTADTKAQRLPYNGGDLCLNPELNIYLRESEFPELKNYIGDDLIVTDGTSLLGADDKAALAAIMNALQFLISHPEIMEKLKLGLCQMKSRGYGGPKPSMFQSLAQILATLWIAAVLENLFTKTGMRVMQKLSLPASLHTLCQRKASLRTLF